MKLNWNNLGKGLSAIAGAKQAQDLAQESAKYDVTEGAYGPGLQQNIQQLEGMRAQDPAQAAAYDQAIGELTRRQGLQAPDFSVAGAPTNFASRQEARQAASPMRAEGLASVYRRYGDVERADALEERAYEQQRGLARDKRAESAETRAQSAETRAQQQFESGQKLVGLQIGEASSQSDRRKARQVAQAQLAELAASGTPIDTATANRIAQQTGADLDDVADAVLKQYGMTKASAADAIERQLVEFNKAAQGGIPALNKYIAEKLDPDKTDNVVPEVVQGADGKLRVMYGNSPLPGYQSYGDLNQLSAAFQGNIKRDPLGAAIQISTLQTAEQSRLASQQQIAASQAQVKIAQQQLGLAQAAANRAPRDNAAAAIKALEARGIKLSDAQIQALYGAPVQTPKLPTQSEVTAGAKLLMAQNPDMPLAEALQQSYAAMTGQGAAGAGGIADRYIQALTAGAQTPAGTPPPVPETPKPNTGLRTGGQANPYVDAQGRALPRAQVPMGQGSLASELIPAAAEKVERGLGTNAAATRYLNSKIGRNEPLTPAEQARAIRLGLISP